MKTLKSHVLGAWHEATDGFATLHDPTTEEPIARASSAGIDFGAVLEYARTKGQAALRPLTFAERGKLVKSMSRAIHDARDELIELSMRSTGCTRKDAKFDLDGATGTLMFYAGVGKQIGDRRVLPDGPGAQLGRTARFYGEHGRVPRRGAAVHVNAFNFPAWGFAEKAACSILAGMPVISKPATSTAMVTERCVELVVEAGALPDGVFQFVCGSAGDLISRLGGQDVLAFTGSATTGNKLRSLPNLLESSTPVNIEADSLNAAVLGPKVDDDTETWDLFLADVHREITQKAGQKCTAVRRIFVPADRMDEVQEALIASLEGAVVGNPFEDGVNLGALATEAQLEDAVAGVKKLAEAADIVFGTGERIDGKGAEAGKGWFFGPVLLRAKEARAAKVVHEHEVFGPVATLLPYDGSAAEAAELVGLAEGSLVTSVYSNSSEFLEEFVFEAGAYNGRIYIGTEKMAPLGMGSGIALPQSLHGGPGRAGGGEELGDLRGLGLYTQRLAVQGDRKILETIGFGESGREPKAEDVHMHVHEGVPARARPFRESHGFRIVQASGSPAGCFRREGNPAATN